MLTTLAYPPLLYHFLRRAYKKGGSGLNVVVRSLPPEQFAIASTSAVLSLMDTWMEAAVARYGRGNFRWVTMIGDLSAIIQQCMMRLTLL